MRRTALALAAAALLISAAPAQATTRHASAFAFNYLTPVVRINPGDSLVFKNLDLFAQHNLVSNRLLFGTPIIPRGVSVPVVGVSSLPVGNYLFHCDLHPWMRGVVVVRKI